MDDAIEREAASLDIYYTTARYPDAVADEDPGDVISRDDALVAVTRAERVFFAMRSRIESVDAR